MVTAAAASKDEKPFRASRGSTLIRTARMFQVPRALRVLSYGELPEGAYSMPARRSLKDPWRPRSFRPPLGSGFRRRRLLVSVTAFPGVSRETGGPVKCAGGRD